MLGVIVSTSVSKIQTSLKT